MDTNLMTHDATRRRFLRTLGAGVAMTLAPGLSGCGGGNGGESGGDSDGGFRLSVASWGLRYFPGPEMVAMTFSLGVTMNELWPGHAAVTAPGQRDDAAAAYHANPEAWAALAEVYRAEGVTCAAYGVHGFREEDAPHRQVLAWAQSARVETIAASPTPEALDVLSTLVAEFDVTIGIHNHGPEDAQRGTIAQVAALLRDRHPHIGACVDVGHYWRAGQDPVEAIETFGDRVYGVHLKDYVDTHDPAGPDWRLNRVPVGEGKLDTPAILAALRRIGFTGPLSIEHGADPEDPLPGIARSVENVRAMIADMG